MYALQMLKPIGVNNNPDKHYNETTVIATYIAIRRLTYQLTVSLCAKKEI